MAIEGITTHRALDEAKREGVSYSTWLEKKDPTSKYPAHEQNMDAFQRQLARLDIRVNNDPLTGAKAHNLERFYDNSDGKGEERSSLFGEWINRTYRAADNYLVTGKRLFDAQNPVSYTLYPPTVLPELRFKQIQPSALPYLVARTRSIQSETFKALYLNDSAATSEARYRRITEGSEFPTVQFVTSESAVTVRKYGGRLKMTYEQLRRTSMDLVSWAINYVAAQAARDKEDDALDVLINGDGNTSTPATSTNGSTLDGAAAGALTLKMFMLWRLTKWVRPYRPTVIAGTPTAVGTLALLQAASANLAPSVVVGSNTAMNPVNLNFVRQTFDGLYVVDNTTVTASTLLGIDGNNTLEMISEANTDIVETDRVINGQWQEIVMSENIGWAIATLGQNQMLAYTA